jgi:hypothetical protein
MVNINKYATILHEFKTKGCDRTGAKNLLTEAAQIKETDGFDLTKWLFNYT